MDPRWLILAGVIAELIGVVLLASKAQDDPVDGRQTTSSQRHEAVSGSGARPTRPG